MQHWTMPPTSRGSTMTYSVASRRDRRSNAHLWPTTKGRATAMVYRYTQISQYLRCPRSYRYRYLHGWREKETRAAMAFGRCFEKSLGAYWSRG
jgi:hypothetical protein